MQIFKLITSLLLVGITTIVSANEFIFTPTISVGKITKSSSEADLVQFYGKNNVKRHKIDVGEGIEVDGTIIFPNTNKEITIEWKKNFTNPIRITIQGDTTPWVTNTGIKIGTTLTELESINGNAFKLTGFEWDYPGRTVSWENGKLPIQLQIDLDSNVNLPFEEYRKVLGSSDYSSDNKIIRKMKLKVTRMYVRWDI